MGKKKKVILPPILPPELKEEEIEVSDEDLEFVSGNKAFANFLTRLDTKSIDRYNLFSAFIIFFPVLLSLLGYHYPMISLGIDHLLSLLSSFTLDFNSSYLSYYLSTSL